MTSDGHPAGLAGTGERAPAPQLRALLLCDLAPAALEVGSDEAGSVPLLREHDRLVRELLAAHGGFEADRTDGFLALFERPIQAVAFALDYQRGLRALRDSKGRPLAGRVGIHVGDVVTWNNGREEVRHGVRGVEVEGLAKPVAARLMHLARPGQILLSSIAQALAQRAEGELGEAAARVRWMGHGPYRFKGVSAPMEVHEVGEPGIAPLSPPPSDGKALRATPWWRRPTAIAAELAAVLAVAVTLFMLSGRPQPAIAFVERDWVVVGDLRNLTRDPGLTDALEVAFRISLEQSRHVNVLSDLKVRDTLGRMRRAPDTRIDRETGAEIALREGARALILPSVAEVGGRVRVSAEVIDPTTLTTVYAESHDGVGIESTLRSMDQVTSALRARLGETLHTIETDSLPLPEVTTADLSALRAYARAEDAFGRGDFGEAERQFTLAIGRDPDFALAHLGLARLHMGADDFVASRHHLERALAAPRRLAAHERILLEIFDASFRSLDETLERLRVAADLHPDRFWVHSLYALWAWERGNHYRRAVERARRALAPQNPARPAVHYLLGMLSLGMEEREQALEHFRLALAQGRQGLQLYHVAAHAAGRDFAAAEAVLEGMRLSGNTSNDFFRHLTRIELAVDQGDFARADALVAEALDAARADGLPELARLVATIQFSLVALHGDPSMMATLAAARIQDEIEAATDAGNPKPDHALFRAQFAAWLAARHGHPQLARDALPTLSSLVAQRGQPLPTQMLRILEAQVRLADGEAETARGLLSGDSDDSVLLMAALTLREALAALGRNEQARILSAEIASRRGRAYVESGGLGAQRALLVAESVLARLREAELALAEGQITQASRALADFRAAWAEATLPPALAQRARAVELRIEATPVVATQSSM
jgi:putative peptide modification system cyclase